MDIRKLQRAIVDGLEDVKAQDILVFNTEHLSPLFERVIVASGQSNRQTKALASSVRETVKARGLSVLRTEGEDNGEWIIVDCGAAVAHIMQPSIREYYHLEEIWGGKPVKIKLGAAQGGLVKASEPIDDDDAPAPKARAARPRAAGTAPAPAPAAAKKKQAAAKKTGPRHPAAATAPARGGSAKSGDAFLATAKRGLAKAKAGKKAATADVKKVVVPAHSARQATAKKAAARKATSAPRGAPAKSAGRKPAATKASPARKAPARRG